MKKNLISLFLALDFTIGYGNIPKPTRAVNCECLKLIEFEKKGIMLLTNMS